MTFSHSIKVRELSKNNQNSKQFRKKVSVKESFFYIFAIVKNNQNSKQFRKKVSVKESFFYIFAIVNKQSHEL